MAAGGQVACSMQLTGLLLIAPLYPEQRQQLAQCHLILEAPTLNSVLTLTWEDTLQDMIMQWWLVS